MNTLNTFKRIHLAAILLILLLNACVSDKILQPSTVPQEKDALATAGEVRLTLLHTNDHHGRFWQNKKGEYGMAARQTLIKQIRRQVAQDGGYVLLLSGGDINTGIPESDLLDAEPDFKGMAAIGYDAMALGNHEFDNAMSVLQQQQEWVNFPFLAANIYNRESASREFQPYQIFQVGDKRVAVLGLTTEDTTKIGNPEYISGLEFRSPIKEAAQLVPRLRQKADYIIAVTHMGHYRDGAHRNNAPGDVSLARQVAGIDVIIGGHSQLPLFEPDRQNGTYILQAYEWGKYVGRLDAILKSDGSLEVQSYELLPVNVKDEDKNYQGQELSEDAEMLALLQPYQESGDQQLGVALAEVDGKLEGDRKAVRYYETNLGNLIALAMKEKTDADIAIMNSGGIRDSIGPGAISYRDVLKVQPFANNLVTANISGLELQDYLKVIATLAPGSGAFPQFAGISFKVRAGEVSKLMVGGKPVMAEKKYLLVVNSFVAAGGDGYPKLVQHPSYVDTGYVDADALADYLRAKGKLRLDDYAVTKKVTGIGN